jgi:predicted NAD-dependent protein-ADP-ribosyltransferase YbiA (DUF1768 family)
VTVVYSGLDFDCVENAYQAAKSLDKELQTQFSRMSPYETKVWWEDHTGIRPDWQSVCLGLMKDFVAQKFANPELAQMLIATGEAQLEEGNDWGDTFWGVCEGVRENNLGKILMSLREKFV